MGKQIQRLQRDRKETDRKAQERWTSCSLTRWTDRW